MNAEIFDLEKSLNQLSEIVDTLDSSTLSIEQSLKHYEQGMQLVTQCQQYLNQSKARIEKIEKKRGIIQASPIDSDQIGQD